MPATLTKATTPVEELRWLLMRITKSRLLEGVSRVVLAKIVHHFWVCVGVHRCMQSRAAILAIEGKRASGDHTYHVVSNLAAYDDYGKAVMLRASLASIMGERFVLGCTVSIRFLQQPVVAFACDGARTCRFTIPYSC